MCTQPCTTCAASIHTCHAAPLCTIARRGLTSPVDSAVLSRLLTPTQSSIARSRSAGALSADGENAPGNLGEHHRQVDKTRRVHSELERGREKGGESQREKGGVTERYEMGKATVTPVSELGCPLDPPPPHPFIRCLTSAALHLLCRSGDLQMVVLFLAV